ncbi:MAG: glycolate oxidase subunit GlcF [Halioglobus sp.]
MHIELHPRFADTPQGKEAQALTSACVHCGFCLATCPTYLDTRDERDSPRGRIYLVKQLLETGEAGPATQTHLDRCLTCRNCETTCPSGMEYGQLLDIGKGLMEKEAPRSLVASTFRAGIRALFSRPTLLRLLMLPAQGVRRVLPLALKAKVPPYQKAGALPEQTHTRTMLILEGCVQRAATPLTNGAAKRVMHRLGITLVGAPRAGCCGALDYHLGAHDPGLNAMRNNIDAWWPHIENGAEAIVSSASGCGAMLIDYGRLLAHDPGYAEKAQRVSALSKDLSELVAAEDLTPLNVADRADTIAVHTPCTLTHALKQPGHVNDILTRVGLKTTSEATTLCCGSAGTYSLLEPERSTRIRSTALQSLRQDNPDIIATANVGCQLQLLGGVEADANKACSVKHWIELLDQPS